MADPSSQGLAQQGERGGVVGSQCEVGRVAGREPLHEGGQLVHGDVVQHPDALGRHVQPDAGQALAELHVHVLEERTARQLRPRRDVGCPREDEGERGRGIGVRHRADRHGGAAGQGARPVGQARLGEASSARGWRHDLLQVRSGRSRSVRRSRSHRGRGSRGTPYHAPHGSRPAAPVSMRPADAAPERLSVGDVPGGGGTAAVGHRLPAFGEVAQVDPQLGQHGGPELVPGGGRRRRHAAVAQVAAQQFERRAQALDRSNPAVPGVRGPPNGPTARPASAARSATGSHFHADRDARRGGWLRRRRPRSGVRGQGRGRGQRSGRPGGRCLGERVDESRAGRGRSGLREACGPASGRRAASRRSGSRPRPTSGRCWC